MLPRILIILGLFWMARSTWAAAATDSPLPDGLYAEFTTPRGVFTARLDYERVPMTVNSFVGRAEGTITPRNGKPFYTGLRWYRVVPDFVIQSGDPTNPGEGTPDRKPPAKANGLASHPLPFPDEMVPGLHHDSAGVLSMANAGPDTNSTEFFITLRETNRLNYLHSIFGRVVRGLEALSRIRQNDPFTIRIIRLGQAARAFAADELAFNERVAAAKPYAFAYEPNAATHFHDPNKLLPQEWTRELNFNFKLANFERFTGRRICARIFAKSPSAAEDAKPGAYMSTLAAKLGIGRTGVLVVYFADEKDWRIWFADDAVAVILGRAPTAADLAPEGPLHQAKMAFIDAAVAAGDAEFAAQQKAAPANLPPTPAQRLKLQMDAVLDRLIVLCEPKS